jgi:hypothetical protein
MPALPHDAKDLRLAPVVLALDARIDELARLKLAELHLHVALVGDRPDWNREFRAEGLLAAVRRGLDCHDWELSWHSRGIRVSRGGHQLVLGVPASFTDYLAARHRRPALIPNAR